MRRPRRVERLAVSSEVRQGIGLTDQLPHYSTLKQFSVRPGVADVMHAMRATLAQAVQEADTRRCKDAAMDATGLPITWASAEWVPERCADWGVMSVIKPVRHGMGPPAGCAARR